MRAPLAGGALVLVGALLPLPATTAHATPAAPDGSVAREWTAAALDTVRATSAGDAAAARLYAMVDSAVFDAVNALAPRERRRTSAVVAPDSTASGDPVAAAAQAAHDVLTGLYPARSASYDAVLTGDLAALPSSDAVARGRRWGARVGAAVLAARADDGSQGTQTQPGSTGPGVFTASWSGTQFRSLRPFVIADPSSYAVDSRPALTSQEYADAWDEVRRVGSAAVDDPQALDTYRFWSLGAGTDQPAGAWQQVASTLSNGMSLQDTARLLTVQALAMVDTVAPTYTTKVVAHSWRPTTAIRQADTDGNDGTTADPTWSARAGSVGSSPEHWSGHSSFSAAGALALGAVLCRDAVPFVLTTDSGGGASRTFARLSTAALEAGQSRVLGGLHFPFSNRAGLRAGAAVAVEVVSHALRPIQGHDSC